MVKHVRNKGIFEEAAQNLSQGRPVPDYIRPDGSASRCVGGVDLPPAAA